MPVTQPPSPHAQHDALLIAKLAANDVNAPERAKATALITECQDCADLRRDLDAIRLATRALPAPVRRGDFRLTEADAARLRPPTWRTWLERLAAPRFAYTQRVGAGLAALGIAGLLFASLPGSLLTGTTSSVLDRAGAPIGQSSTSVGTAGAGPSAPGTAKSESSATGQPLAPVASGPSLQVSAADQSAAPSAAAGVAAIPAPTAAPTAAAQSAPSAPLPSAGSLHAPTARPTAAPFVVLTPGNGASTSQYDASGASAAPAESVTPEIAATAPPASAPPAAQATGGVRVVPQGVSPSGRDAGGSGSSSGLSPLALASIVVSLFGLGLLLARRMAVRLTSR